MSRARRRLAVALALAVLALVLLWALWPRRPRPTELPVGTATAEWPHYGGDVGGLRYTTLDQITPENLDAKVNEFLSGKGIDALKLGQCTGDAKTADLIEASLKEGRAIGVTSTPTMFVNGRKLTGSVKWEQLQQIIDFEIEYQKVAKNAGDDCGCAIGAEFPPAQ